jgi:AraC-like DNA-binding protein
MAWFEPRPPADDLCPVLECTWDAVIEGRHDLVPDGSVELLWIADRGLWVCGPDRSGWSFTLPAGTATTGLRFRPGAGAGLLRLAALDLVDQRVRLGDALADGVERRLDDQLSTVSGGSARRRLLERFARQRLHDTAAEAPMVVAAALLGRAPHPFGTLDRVADGFGMSERQFRRRFTQAVGYGPAFFTRVARMQRFLRLAAARRSGLAELAATAGYTDQAHLHHDCVELARMTPRRLLAVLDHTSVLTDARGGRSVQDGSHRPTPAWAR